MKIDQTLSLILMISTICYSVASSQTQLLLEGPRFGNSDPLAEIIANGENVPFTTGLSVLSYNLTGYGLAGKFTGSATGIVAVGFNNVGVQGASEAGIGVKGESLSSYGGYFINSEKSKPDLVVGGNLTNANGIIASDPAFSASSLLLRSNNSLLFQLDHDNNSDGFFALHNGAGSAVMSVGEIGDMALAGNSNLARPHLLLTETEAGDFARLRLKSTSTADYWDIAGGSFLNSQLNFYRSNVGNILQLNAIGNPITTSTGAYLSSAGVWTNAPGSHSGKEFREVLGPSVGSLCAN